MKEKALSFDLLSCCSTHTKLGKRKGFEMESRVGMHYFAVENTSYDSFAVWDSVPQSRGLQCKQKTIFF